jgi:2-methylcitrate dehydratase PrpD
MGLDFETLQHAEGIAREMVQPLDSAMFHPPTHMVKVHQGFICQDAINACLLAQKGVTGPTHDILLPPRGYLGLAHWETDPSALTDGLGEQWEMLNVEVKPYVGCKSAHTAMYGALDLMEKNNIAVGDIFSIEVQHDPADFALVSYPKEEKWNPRTIYEYQFSLPFLVATAVYDKEVFLPAYGEGSRNRKSVRELMTKISAAEDASLPMWASRVSITHKDGRKISGEYYYVKGHPKNPFTEEELIDKFKKCLPYSAHEVNETSVESLIDAIINLEKVRDVERDILAPLTPGFH